MSENIRQFIDQLAAGQAAEAKDTLENELAARSFAALDEYKKEIAQSIFGGNQETEEEVTSEEELLTQEEFDALSEEEQEIYLESLEQLNELSPALKKRYIMKADKDAAKKAGSVWRSPSSQNAADKIKMRQVQKRKEGMQRAYKSFDVK